MSQSSEGRTPSQIFNDVTVCLQANQAPMLHGDPGIGKSQIVQQAADFLFAEKYGYKIDTQGRLIGQVSKDIPLPKKSHIIQFKTVQEWTPVPTDFQRPWFVDFRAALRDSVDLMGIPRVDEKNITRYSRPADLPTDDRGGVFFLDELNRGEKQTQNGCFQLPLDKRVGPHQIPATWRIASAVNDKDMGAGKMSGALKSRFVHLDMKTDLEDVIRVALNRDWSPVVIAFLKFRPDLLHNYLPNDRVSPNPRAWEFVSDLVTAHNGGDRDMLLALTTGTLGKGAGLEFTKFYDMWKKLPSIDAILLDPANTEVPKEPSVQFAISAALSRRATENTFYNIIKYCERLPVEYNVRCIREIVAVRKPELAHSPEFTKWISRHADVTL